VRRRATLTVPEAEDRDLVVLGAAKLGDTRLIDNLECLAPR
jgi:pantothenate synthetase